MEVRLSLLIGSAGFYSQSLLGACSGTTGLTCKGHIVPNVEVRDGTAFKF